MTSWKPDFAPYLEIQYDLNVNESGYKEGIATRFRKVLKVEAQLVGTSGIATLAPLTVNWSGGAYDVYVHTSNAIVQASKAFCATIYGIL